MSQENIDLLHAYHAAYSARKLSAAIDLCASNVEVFPDASVWLEPRPLVGRDEFRALLEDSWSAWKSCSAKIEEVRDLGDGRVLARGEWGGIGITSDAESYTSLSTIFTVRDGQIARVQYFFDHAKALEAVGLSE